MKHWTHALILGGASLSMGALVAFAVAAQQQKGTPIAGAAIGLDDLFSNLMPDPADPKGKDKQTLSMVSLGAGAAGALALFVVARGLIK